MSSPFVALPSPLIGKPTGLWEFFCRYIAQAAKCRADALLELMLCLINIIKFLQGALKTLRPSVSSRAFISGAAPLGLHDAPLGYLDLPLGLLLLL